MRRLRQNAPLGCFLPDLRFSSVECGQRRHRAITDGPCLDQLRLRISGVLVELLLRLNLRYAGQARTGLLICKDPCQPADSLLQQYTGLAHQPLGARTDRHDLVQPLTE